MQVLGLGFPFRVVLNALFDLLLNLLSIGLLSLERVPEFGDFLLEELILLVSYFQVEAEGLILVGLEVENGDSVGELALLLLVEALDFEYKGHEALNEPVPLAGVNQGLKLVLYVLDKAFLVPNGALLVAQA